MPILLRKEKNHPNRKQQKGNRTPVMTQESMAQGKGSDQKSQDDHAGFKPEIMYDIDSEDRQARQEQG